MECTSGNCGWQGTGRNRKLVMCEVCEGQLNEYYSTRQYNPVTRASGTEGILAEDLIMDTIEEE